MSNIKKPYFKSAIGQQRLQEIGLIALMVGICSLAIVLILDILGILICVIIVSIVFLVMFLIIRWDASNYCSFCRKRVHPLFKSHICEIDTKNMDLKLKSFISYCIKPYLNEIQLIIENLENLGVFSHKDESDIFKDNMISLRAFELIGNYKYAIIGMGSILEFMVVRYCKINNISPNPTNKSNFASYLKTAINRNLFGQKNSWLTIQHNLRIFRNYVHIEKEMTEEPIDDGWYIAIKNVFEKVLSNFK